MNEGRGTGGGPLQTLIRAGSFAGWTDGQLLERFDTDRDEVGQCAFAALVQRHGAGVLRVCRGVLGDPHDAEDAFQATFLVLARKARSIRDREAVGPWLLGVAYRVAGCARSATRRRRAHERRAAGGAPTAVADAEPGDWVPLLHQEIGCLPEKFRTPLVLCYLEGLTQDEVARRLRWPIGTVRSRLARGREHLRRRLVLRGVTPAVAAIAVGSAREVGAVAVPEALVQLTARAAAGAAGHPATVGAISTTVATLTGEVLTTMTWTRLKIHGAVLAAGLLVAGAGVVAGQAGALPGRGPAGADEKAIVARPEPRERRPDEAAPSIIDRDRARAAHSGLTADDVKKNVVTAAESRNRADRKDLGIDPGGAAAQQAARLAQLLERHPARPSTAAKRVAGLFLLDITSGRATLIADEPDPGVGYCGCPDWSSDGGRILFDAMNADHVAQSHIKMISIIDGRPVTTDLGGGNCPTLSPDGRRIAFLNNLGPPAGVWLMHADGSQREALGAYGRPQWSPDGHQMMMTSFSSPCDVTMMDAEPQKSGPLQIPGSRIFSVPRWAAEKTIVAVVGDNDTIALVDTTEPAEGRIKEVLWKKGKGLDVTPEYPSYSPATGEYVFVGTGPEGMALYAFRRGQKDPPRRLEPRGHDKMLRDPTFSPDGRYLVFTSDRPAPRPKGAGPGAAPARDDGR